MRSFRPLLGATLALVTLAGCGTHLVAGNVKQAANFGASYGCEFVDPQGRPYSPDFAALGRACGADGYLIERAEDLVTALRTAISRRRPAVLDVPMVNEPVPTPGHWNIKDIYHGVFE